MEKNGDDFGADRKKTETCLELVAVLLRCCRGGGCVSVGGSVLKAVGQTFIESIPSDSIN